MKPSITQLLHDFDQPRGWSAAVRLVFCGAAALLTGVDLGFQGNGNLVWSGVFLGFVLGVVWSAALLFGLPLLVRGLHPSMRIAFGAAGLFAVLALFVFICFQMWGY